MDHSQLRSANQIVSLRCQSQLAGCTLNLTCTRPVIGWALARAWKTELNPESHSFATTMTPRCLKDRVKIQLTNHLQFYNNVADFAYFTYILIQILFDWGLKNQCLGLSCQYWLVFFFLGRTDDVTERTDKKFTGDHHQIYFTHPKKLKETICKGSSEKREKRLWRVL